MAERQGVMWVVGTLALGAVLAIVALASILAGYILIAVFVLVLLAAEAGMSIAALVMFTRHLVSRRALTVAAGQPQAVSIARAPVVACLTAVEAPGGGSVPCAAGSEFTFLTDRRVTPVLCGPALKGLLPYVHDLRVAKDGHVARVRCPVSGTILVFELHAAVPAHVGPSTAAA
ncbi:MAG: hypothetical protein HYX97_02040 [Chloroflexi bacterium]|nr:hypothetical protein [Chloroflexota bacterium]